VYLHPMKVLVFGSRKWLDQAVIERELRKLPPGTTVIHGGAPGADNIGGYVAETLGFTVRVYPALWSKHGRGAGPIRNQTMLDREHLETDPFDHAICFHTDPGLGIGSKDMRARCEKVGLRVDIFFK
jgi:YspA, cpYpsA-related SLOG family